MSKDDVDFGLNANNPLTEAILEAADDLEKGRPLNTSGAAFGKPDDAGPLADLPAAASAESEEPAESAPAKPKKVRKSFMSRLAEASPYTVVLAIAMLALLVGLVLMILEMNSLGWQIKPTV